jgi:DNA-binding transcriptional LysR family regulator
MNDAMYAAQCTLDGTIESTAGTVKISLPLGQGGIPLLKSLTGFHAKYPDICVDLIDGPLQNNLGRREADIDLRMERPTELDLITRNVGHFHTAFWATEEYLRHHPMPKDASEPNEIGVPLPELSTIQGYVTQLNELGIHPARFPVRLSCTNNHYFRLMLGGLGMTMVAMPLGYPFAGAVRVLPEMTTRSPDFWLAMHSSLRRNARIRAVWDWLVLHLPEAMERSCPDSADKS